MALLHRDHTEERADTRLGDERLMGDEPVEGPATVDRDKDGVDDRAEKAEKERVEKDRDREVVRPSRTETMGLVIRTAIFTLAVAAIVIVCTQNPDDVTVDLLFDDYSMPQWVVIALAAAVGCIAGLMVRSSRRRVRT